MFLYIKTNILRGYGIFKNDFAHPREPANDVSILTLANRITFSPTASPVCLPAVPDDLLYPDYTGTVATVTGWGETGTGGGGSPYLQEADVTVTSNEECGIAYPKEIKGYPIQMH